MKFVTKYFYSREVIESCGNKKSFLLHEICKSFDKRVMDSKELISALISMREGVNEIDKKYGFYNKTTLNLKQLEGIEFKIMVIFNAFVGEIYISRIKE